MSAATLRQRKAGAAAATPAPQAKAVKETPAPSGSKWNRGLQFMFVTAFVAPWIAIYSGAFPELNALRTSLVSGKFINTAFFADAQPLSVEAAFTTDDTLLTLLAALSVPHVYYFFLWTQSKHFEKLCSALSLGKPYMVYMCTAQVIKIFQITAFAAWYLGDAGVQDLLTNPVAETVSTIINFFVTRHKLGLLLGGQLLICGQLFNTGVYQTLGSKGVYYGARLGENIPWVHGFPFSVIPHPQYAGATISIWGAVILLATAAHVTSGIYVVGVMMTVFYICSSYVEGNL